MPVTQSLPSSIDPRCSARATRYEPRARLGSHTTQPHLENGSVYRQYGPAGLDPNRNLKPIARTIVSS